MHGGHGDKLVSVVPDQIENSFCLLLRQSPLISQLTFHLVGTEFDRCNLTLSIEDSALALPPVIGPLSIIDCVLGVHIEAPSAGSLAIDVVTHIDIARLLVLEASLLIFPVRLPVSFVD